MKKPRKIAIITLFCLLSAQLNAAFSIAPMAEAAQHAMAIATDQHSRQHSGSAHQHGHAGMQAEQQSGDCLDSGAGSEHHQATDCEDNCMDCVNHCSSIGIQSKACNFVDYAHRTADAVERDAFFRIENPFRPPIFS